MMKNMTPRAETENLKVMTPKFLGKTSINLMTQYPVIHKKMSGLLEAFWEHKYEYVS